MIAERQLTSAADGYELHYQTGYVFLVPKKTCCQFVLFDSRTRSVVFPSSVSVSSVYCTIMLNTSVWNHLHVWALIHYYNIWEHSMFLFLQFCHPKILWCGHYIIYYLFPFICVFFLSFFLLMVPFMLYVLKPPMEAFCFIYCLIYTCCWKSLFISKLETCIIN